MYYVLFSFTLTPTAAAAFTSKTQLRVKLFNTFVFDLKNISC